MGDEPNQQHTVQENDPSAKARRTQQTVPFQVGGSRGIQPETIDCGNIELIILT